MYDYANISRVKRNIEKMITQGAPETEIDQYVSMEGVSNQDLHTHKEQSRLLKQQESEMPWVQKAAVGLGRGLTDVGQGVKQLSLEAGEGLGLVDQGTASQYTKDTMDDNAYYDSTPVGDSMTGKVGRFTGNVAPYMVPVSAPTMVGRALVNTGMGGLVGATTFTDEGDSRLNNTLTGMVTGGGTSLALDGVGKMTGKLVNTYKGNFKSPVAKEVIDLSNKHNVPVSAGDITQSAVLPKAEAATEYLPVVGMGKYRANQNTKAQEAVTRVLDDLDPNGDWAKIAQTSLKNQAAKVKQQASHNYDNVSRMADEIGNVPTERMNTIAREIIETELQKKAAYQDTRLIHELSKYMESPDMNFSGVRQIRSDLGSLIDDYYKGANGVVGKKGADSLQKIKNALEMDLEDFATTNGNDLMIAWKKADNYYKGTVVPFKDATIARAVKSDTPDEIYQMFIKRGKGDRAQKFFNALDDKGRDAIKYKMVEDAHQNATRGNHFSPLTFARKLEDIQEATGVFFKGAQKQELDGLTKLLRHVQRAGQYMENPPTGQRVVPYLAAGAATINPALVGKMLGSSAAIRVLTTSDVGKRLLLSASKLEIGSPVMNQLLQQLERLITRGAVEATTQPR